MTEQSKREWVLGDKVNFRKYGTDQTGLISAIRVTEEVVTTQFLDGSEASADKRSRRAKYRVDYTLKGGSEVREWMNAATFGA